jgi:hypothetical protein
VSFCHCVIVFMNRDILAHTCMHVFRILS